MALDLDQLISAVTRTLSSRDVGGAPAWVVTAARGYAVPPEELWDAITSAERIPQWFLPVSGDLRPGGRYQLEGNAGGEVLQCDRPRRLAITWEMQGQTSWVTVRLSDDEPGATRLELEHAAHVPQEFWDQFGPGAVGVGWDHVLLGLDQHFVVGDGITPREAASWVASEEGRGFARRSSDAWRAASVAAGTDPAAARAAAERTTAAYTGDEAAPMEA